MKMNLLSLFCFLLLACSKHHSVTPTSPPPPPPDSTTTTAPTLPAQYGTPFTGVPDPRDVSIYQVNIRAFSSSNDLQGVINRLDSIRSLGVNVIYLMPVYPVGVLKSINSPYCIRSFDSIGTEYGTLTDLRSLVDDAHSRNMAVILDWVVNQTSWDHPWITQHPEWYLHDAGGNIEQLSGYSDVAALNFASTAMRSADDYGDGVLGIPRQYRRLSL